MLVRYMSQQSRHAPGGGGERMMIGLLQRTMDLYVTVHVFVVP